ncbi:hypothetical protein NOCA1190026 [metagenome]|uniref:Type I restriction enzyme R protein N-terminal domain-containing protein n=1 Tax=metagenome TaxID=256318 RepID=A0A2P2CCE4_9ZZZZ
MERLAQYSFDGRSEADVRGDWIEPLLRLLGYGLGTRHPVNREHSYELREPTRMLGSTRIRVDFEPTLFERRLWILEAKKPSSDDLFSTAHLGQAWSYATHPEVDVPLMALCDGTRIGVFDVTRVQWETPVLDMLQADLSARFGELQAVIGARQVAESIRSRQLRHLRGALESQLDLAALDRTLTDVRQIVEAARSVVVARREQVRSEARAAADKAAEAALLAAGSGGEAQRLNVPLGLSSLDMQRLADSVRRKPAHARIAEFDRIDEAVGERAWFNVRVARMAAAVLLTQEEGCEEYCRRVATESFDEITSGFASDPLRAAAYQLQRRLGPLGWRVASLAEEDVERATATVAERVDLEEWLRLDGKLGLTASEHYFRVAQFAPVRFLNRISPWTLSTVTGLIATLDSALADLTPRSLPQRPVTNGWHPAGDPWLEAWLTGDPAVDLATNALKTIASLEADKRVVAVSLDLLERSQ